MQLVERHLVKKDHPSWASIDAAAFASKNLYNQANYQIRQAFIHEGKYLPYAEIFHRIKHMDCYKALPAKVANSTLILLHKNWVAFFQALEAYKADPSAFSGRPRLPKYKDDDDFEYYYASTRQIGAEHAYMALLSGKLTTDVTRQLELIQQPTLVIWGAIGLNNAKYIESHHDISWMKSNTRLVLLPDAGLAVHEEQPERVIATILSWSDEDNTDTSAPENITVEAYCAKCKMKRKMLSPIEVISKDGRSAIRGTCDVCGSNLHRFGRLEQQTLT